MVERRTEHSKTFATATPDRFKTQLFGGPVHYRSPKTGQWADIATTLVDAAPGRVRNGAGPVSVDLARDQARGPLARVGLDDDHSVAFSLQGTAPGRARVEDNRVTYAGVRSQVDLELTVVPDGVKEDIVLHSPAAPDRFVFELDLEGLTAGLNDAGDVVYTDAAGKVRAVTPHGFMADATWVPGTNQGARSEAVRYELSKMAGTTLLTVVADRAWLDDPARSYPVRVDPTFFPVDGPGGRHLPVVPGRRRLPARRPGV